MDHAPPELEELLPRIAVAAVLLDGILDRLFGEAVLKFKRGEGQAVDEQAQVQRPARLIGAVTQLTSDAETVPRMQCGRLRVARRGRPVKQVEMQRAVVHALAQHGNDSALADLVGETGEELLPVDVLAVPIVGDAQCPERLRLRGMKEREPLGHVECVGAVVILRIAGKPS
jgi:hypothetical protein